jgi:hypothetical protein
MHTKCAKDSIREAISNGKLPLRRYNQPEGRDEEEIGYVNVRGRDTAPFHEAQR